jgi:hypothetical protein
MTSYITSENCKNVQDGWGRILADAEEALMQTKRRARALSRSIRLVKTKIDSGKPIPDYLRAA